MEFCPCVLFMLLQITCEAGPVKGGSTVIAFDHGLWQAATARISQFDCFAHFLCLLLQITREAGPVKGGSTVIAFAKDPTGYMWELIQRPQTKEPLCQVGRTGGWGLGIGSILGAEYEG